MMVAVEAAAKLGLKGILAGTACRIRHECNANMKQLSRKP